MKCYPALACKTALAKTPLDSEFRNHRDIGTVPPGPIFSSAFRSNMAEIVGLVCGVPGFVDVLVKTCVAGYDFISTMKAFEGDITDYQYQFEVECETLKTRLRTASSSTRYESKLAELYVTDRRKFQLVVATIIRIAQLFADVQKLENVYGLQIVPNTKAPTNSRTSLSDSPASKLSTKSKIRNFIRNPAERFRHPKPSPQAPKLALQKSPNFTDVDALNALEFLSESELTTDLRFDKVMKLAPELQIVVSSYARLTWTIVDGKRLENFVNQLKDYNNNLKHLMIHHVAVVGMYRLTSYCFGINANSYSSRTGSGDETFNSLYGSLREE
jgi:hypothetical protein